MIRRLFFELHYFLKKARWDSGVSPPELLEHLNASRPGRALDLGCGTGTNAITMAQFGWDVVGMDFSSRAIKEARQKAKSSGMHVLFLQGDVTQLKGINGAFDFVLDIGCFHTLSTAAQKRYTDNLPRILNPQGTLLLYTWLDTSIAQDASLSPEVKITEFFRESCVCTRVVLGSDTASHRLSAWFTMKRAS